MRFEKRVFCVVDKVFEGAFWQVDPLMFRRVSIIVRNSVKIPVVRTRPSDPWHPVDLKELWEFRELVYFPIWRDIKVRYKQTVLGVVWAVLHFGLRLPAAWRDKSS